nr:MAG TPA: hypothetical protein [Caudoviricetes sp.]
MFNILSRIRVVVRLRILISHSTQILHQPEPLCSIVLC